MTSSAILNLSLSFCLCLCYWMFLFLFQGKEKIIFQEELTVPDITPATLKDGTAPHCINDEIIDAMWFAEKVRTHFRYLPDCFCYFFFLSLCLLLEVFTCQTFPLPFSVFSFDNVILLLSLFLSPAFLLFASFR